MEYKSADELLAVLQGRGLEIRDRALAAHFLDTVGYHRLSAYCQFFYDGEKAFDATIPTTIEDVVHLYSFDRRLRLLLTGPLEKVEVTLRSLIIKSIGDYLGATGKSDPIINLFAPELYNLSSKQNIQNLDLAQQTLRSSARSHWDTLYSKAARKASRRGQIITRDEWRKRFGDHFKDLPAWTLLQTSSFGPLVYLYSILRHEIQIEIAEKFRMPVPVLVTAFFGLKELRNACAHHESIWNWDSNTRAVELKFPKRYLAAAAVNSSNRLKIYPYCALIHIFLSPLSNGSSTWHRRLKKLINEYSTMYSTNMGFPDHWQTMPFWCVSDVAKTATYDRLRDRIRTRSDLI